MDVTCHLSLITLQLSLSLHTSTSAAALPSFHCPPAICSSQLPFACFPGTKMKKGRQNQSEFKSEGWQEREMGFREIRVHRKKKGVWQGALAWKTHTLAPSLIPLEATNLASLSLHIFIFLCFHLIINSPVS